MDNEGKIYKAKQDFACGIKQGDLGVIDKSQSGLVYFNQINEHIPIECCEEYIQFRAADVFQIEFNVSLNTHDILKFNNLFEIKKL